MRLTKWLVLTSACGLCLLAGSALAFVADTTIEIKDVHLCCGACVKGVASALKDVEGVTAKCDQKAKTVTLTAKDAAAAKGALKALGSAGYYGKTSADLEIPAASGVPSGTVKSLKLTNAHNCCRSCCVAIKKAVGGVKGVEGDTAKPKTADFEVTGDFDAAAVVKALNAAGFQVQINP